MREATAMPTSRTALAVAVGLVLADSSVVVLALPEIYRELDVSVTAVAWVLVAFNLTLALVAVPSALASRALGPARLTVAGLVVFAGASLACGLADSIEVLLGARCAQAIGGAAAVCAALELMPSVTGSERAAAVAWASAGAIGAAVGPGVGGLLTDLVSWQSIFLVQVPVAIGLAIALAPAASCRERRPGAGVRGPRGRPVPDRAAVHRGLADEPDWSRRRNLGDAARRSRGGANRPDRRWSRAGGCGCDPSRGRAGGAGAVAERDRARDDPSAAPGGRGSRAHVVRPDRGGARGALTAGDPWRLDDCRPARRGRGGAPGAHARVHVRPRHRPRER